MGGFNLQTAHHLFPQVPFHKLRQARKILDEELPIYKHQVTISSIF